VVVTPNGSGTRIKTWRFPPLSGSDVPTVTALLARTESALCIDPHRVYATGISAGGIFATSLACAMPGTFAAIAPVAGVNATKVCASGTPKVSVLAFHGTADPIVPYAGGPYFSGLTQTAPAAGGSASSAASRLRARLRGNATAALGRALQAHPVPEAIAGWAAFDGCSTRPRVQKVATDVQRTTEQHCRRHTGVQLYTVEGGGHTWPGARSLPGRPLGSVTTSIDASDLMLAFFRAHPAPH
jgi:polyhydroxybutyrate depolymerase